MKKIIIPFAATVCFALSLTSCSPGYDENSNFGDVQTYLDDEEYITAKTAFLGQWSLIGCDVSTSTTVMDAFGNTKESLNGHDTYSCHLEWSFNSVSNITLKVAESIHPLIPLSKSYGWGLINEETLLLVLHDDLTGNFAADTPVVMTIDWPNQDEASSAHANYFYDRLNLTVHYQKEGDYDDLDRYYYSYSLNNNRYDGTGCHFLMDVVVTYMLLRD